MLRHTRRWALIVMLGLFATVVVGCGSNDDSDGSSASGGDGDATADPEHQGGELRVALSTLGNHSFDPSTSVAAGVKTYQELVFDYLIGIDEDGQPSEEGGLATGWTTTDTAGAQTYTFTLSDQATFHDGTPVTSADAKFSIEFFMQDASRSANAGLLREIVTAIETPDPQTLVVELNSTFELLPLVLSRGGQQEGMVLPKAYMEEVGAEEFAQAPIGSGPYKFTSLELDSFILLESAGEHWLWGTSRYDSVRFLLSPETGTRLASLEAGEVEIVDLPRSQGEAVEGNDSLGLVEAPGVQVLDMHLHDIFVDGTYLADERVREALNLAIDRQTLLDTFFAGRGEIIGSTEYGTTAVGYRAVEPYDFDPDRARELLDEAFPDGVSLTLHSYPRPGAGEIPEMNQAIASMWEDVGIDVSIENVDYTLHLEDQSARNLDNVVGSFVHPNQPTYQTTASTLWQTGAQFPLAEDPDLDAIIDEYLASTSDLERYGELQADIFDYIRAHHYGVPLFQLDQLYGATADIAGSWQPQPILATDDIFGAAV